MTTKQPGQEPGVRLIEVSVKRELTVWNTFSGTVEISETIFYAKDQTP